MSIDQLQFMPTPWDVEKPLALIKGETAQANKALLDYVKLGDNPSIAELLRRYANEVEPPSRRRATLLKWSAKYHWQQRVAAHNLIQAEQELKLRDAERLRRQMELEDNDWREGQNLRELCGVLMQKLAEHLNTDTRWQDLGVSITQLTQAMKVASDLQRLSTDEPTENIRLSGRVLDAAIERELALLHHRAEASIPELLETSSEQTAVHTEGGAE